MSVLDLARPELLALKPYSSARLEAQGGELMLNANEWPYPDSPWHRYPDPQPEALLQQLAVLYGVSTAQIFVGRGSDEAIDLLVRAFCRAGQDAILISPPTFGMYAVAAGVQGAEVLSVPLRIDGDYSLDVDALIATALARSVKLVFVCTPNNPTGGLVPRSEILRLLEALRGKALVVVDEAYVEFAGVPSLAADLAQHPHLGVLRTLSKAYGLASARLGCLLAAPELIGLLRRIMAPYPVPGPCLAAALEALAPAQGALREERLALIRSERERVAAALRALPAVRRVWPSAANFLCFQIADAESVYRRLLAQGIVLRNVAHYLGLPQVLRLSIGRPEDNQRVLAALAALDSAPQEAAA